MRVTKSDVRSENTIVERNRPFK